jgi:DNA-directed RNA polymerase specialized sigma24 family protein
MTLDWQKYIDIANKFQYKAKADDREDLRQDIILRLAEVASNNGHKPFTEGAMVRVASYTVMAYWRDRMREPTILSLNGESDNGDGDTVELWQTLADDKAIDVEAWIDAKRWLLGCPKRLVQIANKRCLGMLLNHRDQLYLLNHRQKELKKYQTSLFY